MYARVVRFTDVQPDRLAAVAAQIEGSGGPPPGVPATRLQMLVDEQQRTATVIIFFESEDDLRTGAETLEQMDAGETPGTRASVDVCELKLDMSV